jgi:asparagine synthetase B (glutamine-hydrolysing)
MRDKKSVIASYESVFMAVSREHPDSTLALGARENTQSLRATVKRSLGHRSKQPVGLLLSGGVDSTLLAALMLEHLRPMDVYALFWGATTSPDYEWARLAATRLCLDLYCVDSPPIRQQPMDALATSGVPAFQIAEGFRATRAIFPELRLVYCGEGADELYGGYDWTLDPLSRARLLLKRMANAATTTDLIEKTRTVLNRVTSAASLSEVEEVLYALDRGFILTDQHLLPFDVAAGMFGFEVRMPFLDLDHFRFATSLPRRARYDGGRRKPVLKALLSQLIPGLPLEFFERPKVTLPDSLNTLFPSAQVLRPLDIAASEVLSARFGVSAPVAAWLQCLVEESGHFNPAGRPG